MTEQLISFNTAKLAKEKGFNLSTYVGFGERGGKALGKLSTYTSSNLVYARPTQSLLQKWLREKHKIHIIVNPCNTNSELSWSVSIISNILEYNKTYESFMPRVITIKNTYEQALEKGLYEALKLIKP